MTLFSFIVPVYNVVPYLRECLDSILAQQFSDFEVCLVDDGSSDGSGEICDEYARHDARFKVIHQPNGGVSAARNQALDMAQGEYIWFVDADDYIKEGALAYLHQVIALSKADTIFFGAKHMPNGTKPSFTTDNKSSFLCSHFSYCNPFMLFKRSIIEAHQLRFTLGMKMAEDLEFQYKYLLHCELPVAIDYNFYVIREREGSATRASASHLNNYEASKQMLLTMLEYIECTNSKGVDWLGFRMAERLKSMMQSAFVIRIIPTHEVNTFVRYIIKQYCDNGFVAFKSSSFKLANIDIRLYYIGFRILMMFKKKL